VEYLIAVLQRRHGLSRPGARRFLGALFDAIKRGLARDGKVRFGGLGMLVVVKSSPKEVFSAALDRRVVRNKAGRRIVLRASKGDQAKLEPSPLIPPRPPKPPRRNAAKPRRPVRYEYGSPWFSGDLYTDYWRWIWHHELMAKDLKKRGKPVPDYLRPYLDLLPPK
jgi:nucleoid DNA-binding protein